MRYLFTLFSFTILLGIYSQESYRNFSEVNPALENLYNKNIVLRNIQNVDAVYNYFHLNTNRFARKVITSLDVQSKSFDLKSADHVQLALKVNYQFSILRNLSIYGGLSGGTILSKNENNGFITPGLAIVSRKFEIGYVTQMIKGTDKWNLLHSVQGDFNFLTKDNVTRSLKHLEMKIAYLNYWSENSGLNQYLVMHTKLGNISLLLGAHSPDMKNINPLFGIGVHLGDFALDFQTVFTQYEITEMQVSVKYELRSLIRRFYPFRMTVPDF